MNKPLYLSALILSTVCSCAGSGSNTGPVFESAKVVSVQENQTSVIKLQATDSDADTLLYSIDGGDAERFKINPLTGVVTFKIAPNFESKSQYTFIANVSDGNETSSQIMTIQVIDIINESITWMPPAGNATVAYEPNQAFLKLLTIIEDSEISSVSQGRELFIAQWLSAPNSRVALDGLGPLFNANACTACHIANGRVRPYHDEGRLDQSLLIRVSDSTGNAHPVYGGQLQTKATAGDAEATITWSLNNETQKIDYAFNSASQIDGYNTGARLSPHLSGMGLLDLVEDSTLLEFADENDLNNDGISGRPHYVNEESNIRLGRFGWKAINSSLRTQNAGALSQDMGLTSPVHTQENCSHEQTVCAEEVNGGTPEVSEQTLTAIVNFMTALGVPDRRINDQTGFDNGSRLFESIGCSSCHRPTLTTGQSEKFNALSQQLIYPYTDLLLHDMGESLDDGVIEKNAQSNEWRTPPLWGIGIVEQSEGARFLHDGRAENIEQAINWHGGEAEQVKQTYNLLDDNEKNTLLEFLRAI